MSDLSAGSVTGGTGTVRNTGEASPQSSGIGAKDFAVLLSNMLMTQATAQLTSAVAGEGLTGLSSLSAAGSGTDGYLLGALMSAVSSGDGIDPELAMLLLCALGGESTASAGRAESILKTKAAASDAVIAETDGLAPAAGELSIPENAWLPVSPGIKGDETCRSAELLNDIIGQFGVESNPRYRPYKHGSDTYCNIFVWDVTSALGAEIPHYVDAATGRPVSYTDAAGAKELGANGISDWLAEHGEEYGWTEVGAEEAQAWANAGRPAVTAWKNTGGGAGHVQIVRPSESGGYDAVRGVAVAQAGCNNYEYAYLTSTFSSSRIPQVKYYVHA